MNKPISTSGESLEHGRSIVFRNGIVLTMDNAHRVVKDCDVLVVGGGVVGAGTALDAQTRGLRTALVEGQDLEIVTDYTVEGDATRISCSYESLPRSVSPGSTILAADGTLMMVVKEVRPTSVLVRVCSSVTIGEKKNMNLPGVIVDLPTITDKDRDDLVNFGLKYGVDMIAASFVRKASDIDYIRSVLGPSGRHIKIISKIENQEGLHVRRGAARRRGRRVFVLCVLMGLRGWWRPVTTAYSAHSQRPRSSRRRDADLFPCF